ncbi:MAG: L-threonylcarbamoyladenylate synthase [Acholeplasma sp.]|nr:L-threonylcarbamoyladenylate synthase [Acholeplasma sp.]
MQNEVIIFPTDTVYGIGAGLYDEEGIKRIYKIKGRDFNKPLAVLCANLEQIETFAIVDKRVKLIAKLFWPGGLTLILKTNDSYFNKTKEKTIGVRIPKHKFAQRLLIDRGPMKTTSVNTSGEEPLNDYGVIYKKYHNVVNYIYENDEDIDGVSSTVIDLTEELKVIREGNIKIEDILNCLKES